MDGRSPSRRRRVERGIYEQENGKYAVCVMVTGRPHFRTLDAHLDRSTPAANPPADPR